MDPTPPDPATEFEAGATPPAGATLRHDGKDVGRLTSVAPLAGGSGAVALGYVGRVVPVPAAFSYQRRIGDKARLEIFDETGHVPQLERPLRFNRVLEEFLSE